MREFARADDLDLYLAHMFLPLGHGVIALDDANAQTLAWLRAQCGEAQFVTVPRQKLVDRIIRLFANRLSDEAIYALDRRAPLLSARRVVTRRQGWALALGAVLLATVAWMRPGIIVIALVGLMSLLFALSVFFRALLAFWGAAPESRPGAASGSDVPIYTILVPLYREARMLPSLVRALMALDYPRDKLDIKLVVEADDAETVAACRALEGPFEIICVPPSLPRTKPKAVNFALRFARGEHIVIYDAEDRPEPDQLRKAVAAFRVLPPAAVCLQARLAFYNARECWLTRLFALDYALWFGMLLPGLERLGVPIPLGGTSNHFRTAMLREIGAWDPFNVTEDADLGIRISQRGWRVAMLDSTTFEEAPVRLDVWIRQRSRWLKGYMQTWLVHGRATRALIRHTGVRGFLSFQLFIGGAVLSALVNPLLWAAAIGFALFGSHVASEVSTAGAIGSNGMLTCLALAASTRHGERRLAPYALTVTLYWILISVAGYRGLWHLLVKPFHWEKTAHGISRHA